MGDHGLIKTIKINNILLHLVYVVYIAVYFVQCSDHTSLKADRKNRLLLRHPRAADVKSSSASSFGTAVSFSLGELIKLKLGDDKTFPAEVFSVQFWIKPEGGQFRYTPIIDVHDECNREEKIGWTVGIKLPSYSRHDARVVFSLLTEGAIRPSLLYSHKTYEPSTWINVAATFDGTTVRLYMNGAEVALSGEQNGVIFRKTSLDCVGLFIGGRDLEDTYYRGDFDEFGFWDSVLTHEEVVKNMNRKASDFLPKDTRLIAESFDTLENWHIVTAEDPHITASNIVLPYHTVRLETPTCGKTVCDDPEVVMSYMQNRNLRNMKIIKYRVINILDESGKRAQVYDKQIQEQHKTLVKSFEPYNISFQLHVQRVRNTTLFQKEVMFDCHPSQVGDGHCDQECAHATTGNDGGDCDTMESECKNKMLGNGQCDTECNKAYYNYDKGDCCKPGDERAHVTCIDPDNNLRGYMNIEEMKMQLGMGEEEGEINIFFITSSWNRETFRGLATYPWEKNVYSTMGGVVMHVDVFGRPGKTKALVHEFGHILGLWHVHRGVSEMSCDDSCFETRPSMVLGDLCSDTNPTPRNSQCEDPRQLDTCGHDAFRNTPFTNYMSYADDTCTNSFTPQQEARMHCYIDLVYQSMTEQTRPAPVPVAPKVIKADEDSVHLVWLKPLGLDRECDADNALHQYAYTATASHSGVRYAPHEATGFPDADSCNPSRYAWKPYHSTIHPDCDFESCWIELGFKQAVVPKRINIWVADIREDTDLYVELLTVEGEIIPVGDVPAYCDMETTVIVNTDNKPVNKVKIHTVDSYIAIDAVEVVSLTDFPSCRDRTLPTYKITRDPGFPGGAVIVDNNQFVDTMVDIGETYSYSVQTVLDSSISLSSPSLVYAHGQPFCGDGQINSDEECDDQNAVNGDGCMMDCKVEEGFICRDSPSLCSVSQTDSCDETKQVCGIDPPAGFNDQWAVDATVNPEYQSTECPVDVITGKPDKIQRCGSDSVYHFWRPCGTSLDVSGDFWIQIQIYKPVVAVAVIVHVSLDGRSVFDQEKKYIQVALIHTDDSIKTLSPSGLTVTCEEHPLLVPVVQDLSKPFFLTKGVRISFTYSSIGIYAVGVRSSPYINPPGISSCTSNELYYPQHGVCISDKCSKKSCEEYPVKYGEAVCSGLEDGDSCKIQCDDGYFVDGHENRATCVDGSWITSSPLICSPVDCGKPYVSMATVACSDGTTFAKKCHFKCDKPASLRGDDSSLTCQRNGQWSKPSARCVVQCSALQESAYVNGKLKTTSCIKGPQRVGTECKVRCQDGYHVQEGRTKRRFLRILCDDNGEWFGSKCIANTCQPLPRVFTGAYTCTNGFQSGSTCTMSCADDLKNFQTVTCLNSGEWSGNFHICPEDTAKVCPVPESTNHVKFQCEGNEIGASCNVNCPEDHGPVLGKGKTGVEANHKFHGVIECSVVQKWEPSPDQIKCIQPCLKWSINDGFCDAVNNRDVCEWDGGDCCPSTVQGGQVLTMPEDCTVECECRDPLAVENTRRKRRRKHTYWFF